MRILLFQENIELIQHSVKLQPTQHCLIIYILSSIKNNTHNIYLCKIIRQKKKKTYHVNDLKISFKRL